MRTAQYIGDHSVVAATAEPVPPRAGEVQIRVAYTGLCGTDLHIVHGNMDARVQQPLVFGHEMSGVVAAVGDDVTSVTPGDVVTVMPLEWDGTCPACRAGHQHVCQNLDFVGIDSPGSLQELWTVPERIVIPAPSGTDLKHLALVEPVAVAVHDVRRSGAGAGDRVLVIGSGPIGLLIATVARHRGAEVRVSEIDPTRRQQATDLGFDTIDPSASDAVQVVEAWTGGAGADIVFEVSGAAAAVLSATSFLKVRGTLVVVAIHPTPRPIDLQRLFWRELTILGARVYERQDFDEAVRLVTGGAIPADTLITDVVPLEQTGAAFTTLEAGRAMKVLVDVSGDAL
ncbi:alcohol dehydrogenase catalytic domain-containing protein [Curtobacterium albidum]|uniref:Alcohol dehydrogenase catalytic domain-containing protein n=1 Tax=Curtobacterium citreum TaxID=2036 RepID=A0A850DTM3_9MICO|nr:alcohol dehydrogenase catalytic domain-containing protein [Curtobacterium albidum]NUU27868.1 alcohol dehydrogenase catalytic domain-containing protein [Curtobacterium albidum]